MLKIAPTILSTDSPLDDENLAQLPILKSATAFAPYLARLCRMRPETVAALAQNGGEACVRDAISRAKDIDLSVDDASLDKRLRQAKADVHLSLAFLDLSCIWDWNAVTGAFSEFADAAIETALRHACKKAHDAGWVIWEDQTKPLPGLFILALGKLGAFELNYSSDVDVVAMYDPERFPKGNRSIGDAAARIIQAMTRTLETITEHGYVLRVDLRLRPDPRSTPVAVSTTSAELYYTSRGQNWERMAYIKARFSVGDPAASIAFLEDLEPFVWRRHLDFWTIEDIRAIKQQINSTKRNAQIQDLEFDVKLGHGGIREIEFFAQTQQLIHGGRTPALRMPRTINALSLLSEHEHVDDETADILTAAYAELRALEHRVQMLNDEHTHTLKSDPQHRERVAALCGYDDLEQFNSDILEIRDTINGRFSELFKENNELSGIEGNLVFTGVDEDPETIKTLTNLGFSDPSRIIADFQTWHRGGIRATRTERGQQLLTAVQRRLFQLMSETGNPDAAYEGLKTFFGGLSAGIQTLSLLVSNPVILEDLISVFSVAPQMARDLASRPALLEALLDGGFAAPLSEDSCDHLAGIAAVPDNFKDDFEDAMNEVRRFYRDAHVRIRFKLLLGQEDIRTTGRAFTDLADACIRALEPIALAEAERKLGNAPGRWAICGLGKLGSLDLTANSDLDLMVIFDPDEGQAGGQFFARATQRLITALSAQTEEGLLYEADMQLRPSGRAGPVAVKLSAFEEYYRKEAWTWEHMALTRLRTIAGDQSLKTAITTDKEAFLSLNRDPQKLVQDAWDMRARLLRDRPAKHEFDLKLVKGGLIDIEFLAQVSQLIRPMENWNTRHVVDVLHHGMEIGLFSEDEVCKLTESYQKMQIVLAFERAALEKTTPAADWPIILQARAAKSCGFEQFSELIQWIESERSDVWNIFCKKLDPEATEWGKPAV